MLNTYFVVGVLQYFSALQGKSRHYLLARAIQFWTPGIPMVYYVGLLAGRNDREAVQEQQSGRAINRHRFSMEEAAAATEKPVVKALLQLMRFRNTHPAFNGQVRHPPLLLRLQNPAKWDCWLFK